MNYELDCERHPAFTPDLRPAESTDEFFDVFAELDQAVQEHTSSSYKTRHYIERIEKKFEEAVLGDGFILQNVKPYITEGMKNAVRRLTSELEERSKLLAKSDLSNQEALRHAEELYSQGHTVFKMPSSVVSDLIAELMPDIDHLRSRLSDTKELLCMNPRSGAGRSLLNQYCRDAGVFEAVSTYMGRSYSQAGFAVHISHPQDRWYHAFDDLELPITRTANMHFDLSFSVPKAMLYLRDVSEEQGPFSLIPRSTPWENVSMAQAFAREIVYSLMGYRQAIGGSEHAYIRSLLADPGVRDALSSLPKSLQQYSHFGDVVVDGTARSQFLLGSEKQLVGEAGTMPIFSGAHVLHRGGIVSRGERWALQIVFEPDQPVAMTPAKPASFFGRHLQKPLRWSNLMPNLPTTFRRVLDWRTH